MRLVFIGKNSAISPTAFQDGARHLDPRRCPECGGSVPAHAAPFRADSKPFGCTCQTCGGAGLNRHVEAA